MTLEHPAVRETLIKTTLKLMEKGGLETVKARKVAELSEVSVGTIYNLFGNFDGLILAASIKVYAQLQAVGLAAAQRIEKDLADKGLRSARERVLYRLSALADTYVDFVAENANRWNALLAFNRTRGLSGTSDNLQNLTDLMDIIVRMLDEVPVWKTPAERRIAARALWSAVHGVVITNFSVSEQAAARARTSALLNVLLSVITDGMFAKPAKKVA
jgi:AcrR family transcriptional regulator